jgi:hypothetical protein
LIYSPRWDPPQVRYTTPQVALASEGYTVQYIYEDGALF